MVALPGFMADSGADGAMALTRGNPRLSAQVDAYGLDYWPPHASGIARIDATGATQHGPVAPAPRALDGNLAPSYLLDFYNRILIVPAVVNVGSLAGLSVQSVEVWNGHFAPQALASITPTAADGITLSGPPSPPTTFGTLESRLYTLSVSTSGPPTIAASYAFAFPAETPALQVTGTRIIGWPFGPNWAQPVMERMTWATNVLRSRSGVEQRVRLRAAPRRELQYTGLKGDDTARVLQENLLRGWQARAYALPIWADGQYLANGLSQGDTVVALDTTLRDYTAGGLLALRDAAGQVIVRIDTVSPASLLLATPLDRAFGAGTLAAPARAARVQNNVAASYITDSIVQTPLQWQLLDPWTELLPATEAADYRGLPVYLTGTDWGNGVQVDTGRDLATFDPGTSPWAVDDLSGIPTTVRGHAWLLAGRQAIADFRAWCAARAGRLNPFWLPSGQMDARILAAAGSSDAAITVAGQGYANLLVGTPGRRDIAILLASGARIYRRITGASLQADGTEIWGLDAAVGTAFTPADVRSVQFLTPVRLDADAVEISHVTDTIATASLRLRSVGDL